MKTVKVTTDDVVSVIDIDFRDYHSIKNAIGGYFETVCTAKMKEYFGCSIIFLADEEGHIKQLPSNRLGSHFYDTERHGCPIAGDIIFAMQYGEDIEGLLNADAVAVKLLSDFTYLRREANE